MQIFRVQQVSGAVDAPLVLQGQSLDFFTAFGATQNNRFNCQKAGIFSQSNGVIALQTGPVKQDRFLRQPK